MKKRFITVLCAIYAVIPLVFVAPKADTSFTTTNYGSYRFTQGVSQTTFEFAFPGLEAINLTFNSGSYMNLDYQFKEPYSGTITFQVTSSADWILGSSPVYWFVYGDGDGTCYISSTTTMNSISRLKTFTVIFRNVTGIHFGVVAEDNLTFFNSSQSITIQSSTFTEYPELFDIDETLDHVASQFDVYIPGMSSTLTTISSRINTTNTRLQSIINLLNGTTSSPNLINSILSELQYIDQTVFTGFEDLYAALYFDNGDGTFTSFIELFDLYMAGVTQYLTDMYGSITSIDNNIDDYLSYLDYLDDILNAINSIDFSIDADIDLSGLPDYSTVLNTINSTITTINSRLSTISSTITTISTNLTSYIHSNWDIDFWQIPAYQYFYANGYTSGQYSGWTTNTSTGLMQRYINIDQNNTYTPAKAFNVKRGEKFIVSYMSTNGNLLPSAILYEDNDVVIGVANPNERNCEWNKTMIQISPGLYAYYIIIEVKDNFPSTSVSFELEWAIRSYAMPLYVGYYRNIPDEVAALLNLEYDNTYTRLLDDVIDKLEELNNNSSTPFIVQPYQYEVFNWANSIADDVPLEFTNYGPAFTITPDVLDPETQQPLFDTNNYLRLFGPNTYYLVYWSTINNSGLPVVRSTDYYSTINRMIGVQSFAINGKTYYLNYISIKSTQQGYKDFTIYFDSYINNGTFSLIPIYWGNAYNIPDEVARLINIEYNNTYTRLLQQIVNGVGGSSYDTSQYENYEQSIDNVNDSMRNRFDNVDDAFQNNIDNLLNPPQTGGQSDNIFTRFHFNAINSLFTGFLSSIFNVAPALQYILLFGLLLLVLGVLI